MRFKKTTTQIPSSIDPRLQRVIEQSQREVEREMEIRTSSTDAVKNVSIIAKVKDIDEWNRIPGVLQTNPISSAPDKSSQIVTAKVAMNELEAIRQSSTVISLKAPRPVQPLLKKTTEEIAARSNLLPSGVARDHGGQGVIVGIIDFGCDFVHKNFRNQDGSTRILNIWDQAAERINDSSIPYGRVITQDQINQALNSANPYKTLDYPLTPFVEQEDPAHGTHVMDIAAGNGHGTGTPGVAPNADLVFVELAASDIPWGGRDVVDSTLGDSAQLLDAVKFILDTAGERPCVINISLGTNGGPHDGTSLFEQSIDDLLIGKSNRSIVIAASNSFNDGIHASGLVPHGGSVDLHWQIKNRDFTFNELEIWYNGEDKFIVEIITPDGDSIGKIQLGENGVVNDNEGNSLVFVANRRSDPNNGDNEIGIFLERGLPTGTWTVRLHGASVNNGKFHAWIERDDPNEFQPNNQSKFASPNDNSYTLGSISCGHNSIVVGSYDAHDPNTPLSYFSSAGPARDGRQKPEISAPGHAVLAAASGTINGKTKMSGTSMAAPAVTGVVALILAEAQAKGINLTIDQIRDILIKTARKNPPEGEGWNDRYGWGRIDASKAIAEIMSM
ncbi:S8 family peptidase [Bacillus cereus]|uniref:S8 family peptidase n=1 Tax=Bacillus cereus TaxID=1396 RepID=A0A9W7QFM1_BACCE|nr:S8 family peptidase [Bacillus cereus]KAB2393481.1 S8 family peptidase [Bacillus cereus]KAB2407428.1 S8 family peptidase [Bacillus cereus]KAB2428574.1 S8 family peptidase [Bacillus cereus]